MQSLELIFQLIFCLAFGFFAAKLIPKSIQSVCFKILPYFSYILLIGIAMEFQQTLQTIQNPSSILSTSLLVALSTTLGAFFVCYIIFKKLGFTISSGKVSKALFVRSLVNISYAFLALALGYFSAEALNYAQIEYHPNNWYLLLIFMLLIGLDLAHSPLDRAWLNWKILMVPLSCIVGSLLGVCFIFIFLEHINFIDLILLSQGYGFYSMSSIVISELKNPYLGSVALFNDLFREIFAILLMYSIGWRYPRSAISAAGATSMDVTLPMIKQSCGNDFIPHAMLSGFILSILAPLAVSFIAML